VKYCPKCADIDAERAERGRLDDERRLLCKGVKKLHKAFQSAPLDIQVRYWGRDVFDTAVAELLRMWAKEVKD